MKIFKFGGASVKDADGVKNLLNVVNKKADKNTIIVVSAMGKTTNALEKIVSNYFTNKNDLNLLISDLYEYHKRILENCLNSIDRNIKVIIIENSENFELKEFFTKKYNNIKIYCTGSNTGYGKGNNFGISKVTTQYALILNPDTICNKKFFLNLNKLININSKDTS